MNDNINNNNNEYNTRVYPPYYKMSNNQRIFNDSIPNKSFYASQYSNTSYPIHDIKDKLLLSLINIDNINGLLLTIMISLQIIVINLINTLKVIWTNPNISQQNYVASIIYFTLVLSNELKYNFKYNCNNIKNNIITK